MENNERRQIFNDSNIADDKKQEQVLTGIQPKNQFAYKIFRICRALGIIGIILAGLAFGATFIKQTEKITSMTIYRNGVFILAAAALFLLFIMIMMKLLFLRRCPFDDWVFEIAQRRLGTQVIFYTSKCLFIQYDIAAAKEVDKKDFVTEMSDKSNHFSYFLVHTYVDQQVIQVECTKRQPIPDMAKFTTDDDLFWNIVPLGLTRNNQTQGISPIGWWLNDQNRNEELVPTVPSTSILICGGPLSLDTIIPTTRGYSTIKDIKVNDQVFDINNTPVKVLGKSQIFLTKKCYRLGLNNTQSIKCSEDHRFPVICEGGYKDIQVKDLNIGDIIKGTISNYIITTIEEIDIIPTQCILVDSPEHEFIITFTKNNKWQGGNSYTFAGVYTRNTGCHDKDELIIMENNLITDLDKDLE